MELLEREEALAALAEAYHAAARGEGRVVFVTGEPGIGKTSLVTRFLRDLDASARVLAGTCDDLSVPRPLGPIRDLIGSVSPELEQALFAGAAPYDVQTLLVAELELPPRPTVLLLEDVHWADDATFDAITVLGRRIGSLPALLVLTFRVGEAPPGHPLYATVGAIRAEDSVVLELAPLSERAVASIVGGRADEVYAATRGNPFYVTELLGSRASVELPPSVSIAVLGRASRLDDGSRRLVELVSMVPGRASASLLDAVMPDWAGAAVEPERRQLLEVESAYVHFRHELARHAIRSSVPIAGRRRLHAEILAALLAAKADPADIVHHAEAAGAEDVVGDYALIAARRAAELDSNRQAYSLYRRASDFVGRLPAPEQATVLEALATAAYAVGRLEDAFFAIERAISIYGDLGEKEAVGRCTRVLSRFHWVTGHGDAARKAALDAVAILEPLGPSRELARAYSTVSQLEMLSDDADATFAWGARALDLATELGDERTRAHALVNIGTARLNMDGTTTTLVEAHAVAEAAGDRHEAARALDNAGYSLLGWVRPDEALRYAEQAAAYGTGHELFIISSYAAVVVAWLRLRAGEWDEAERLTRREIESGVVVRLITKTVLAELAVRRGDPDAAARLAEVGAEADRTGEPQRTVPVLELAVEWTLTTGAPMPTERLERLVAEIPPGGTLGARYAARVAAWAAVAGIEVAVGTPMSPPHAAMARQDWRAAADAFEEVGWSYDAALMLSLLDDEESLTEAIQIARGLGADPLTRRVAARMRERGLRVPRGPREATRANAAGLTARQLEVLALLAEGLTNAEIADRLVVSPRDRRAPRGRRADEARRDDAPGGRAARVRAPVRRTRLTGDRALDSVPGMLLPYEAWAATCDTLHAHTQVLGKLAVALAPPEPQLQHAALRLSARGWETLPLPAPDGSGAFGVALDLHTHEAIVEHCDGRVERVPLTPDRPVGEVTRELLAAVARLAGSVEIDLRPSEMPWTTPLDQDEEHATYDTRQVADYFAAATRAALVLAALRAPYRGRSTPVNAWWGSFDLAVSLFSGQPAEAPSKDFIMRNAMDSEEVAVGWWPGDPRYPRAAFYAYAHPAPDGFDAATLAPAAARWEASLGEFILDWDDVRAAPDPHATALAFGRSAVLHACTVCGWDPALAASLEGNPPPVS